MMTEFSKNTIPTKLLWIDLEMTGLNPQRDVILEIAAEATDFNFRTLGSYEARFLQKHDVVVERMQKNIWWRDYPTNRDDFVDNLSKGKPPAEIEKELLAFVAEHFGDEPAILAGNSIHNDRLFIKQYMPALDLKLHYRMLDVTSWKVVMQGKYGEDYEKKGLHRAYDDIQASIAELQHYMEWFNSRP